MSLLPDYNTMQTLLKKNKYVILILIFLLMYGTGSILAIFGSYEHRHAYGTKWEDFFILRFGFAVLFAPLVETLVFQHWLMQLATRYLPFSRGWQKWAGALLLSAVIFALGHTYSPYYIFAAFIIGLIFAATYWLFAKRGDMSPVLAVFLLHFTNNFINFIRDGAEYLLTSFFAP